MSRRFVLSLLLIVTLALAACTPAAAPSAGAGLKVVATFSILGDVVQNVGGDRVTVRTLVGADGDAHTFEPAPSDGVALAEAAVVFENGLEFETWLDDLYTASGSKATRVVTSEGVEAIEMEAGLDHEDDDHADEAGTPAAEDDHGHEHGEHDPHIWHSTANMAIVVGNIERALSAADPAGQATYQANAQKYLTELKALEAELTAQIDGLPAERRKLVTSHDTFGYFARQYGFEIVATALAVSTEAAEPSAQEVAELVGEIKAAGVPAIFAENVTNPALITQIAQEAGVKVAPTLYTDALGRPGTPGETYLKLMRYNVSAIVAALKP